MHKKFSWAVTIILLSILLSSCAGPAYSTKTVPPFPPGASTTEPTCPPNMTCTGFRYPTNDTLQRLNDYPHGDFLSDGCTPRLKISPEKATYIKDLIHTGKDIGAEEGDAVYSIASGTIIAISENNAQDSAGWGLSTIAGKIVPNKALIVEHRDSNEVRFYAVYGHIQLAPGITKGVPININDKIGTIGNYLSNGQKADHLHFGISTPEIDLGHLGRVSCSSFAGKVQDNSVNGFTDPIRFIESHKPAPITLKERATQTLTITQTVTLPPVVKLPTPTNTLTLAPAGVGTNWIAFVGFDENIWLVHPDGSDREQITFDGKPSKSGPWGDPITGYRNIKWSPDGSMLGMQRIDENGSRIQAIRISDLSVIPFVSGIQGSFDWLPDGKSIIYADGPFEDPKVRGNQPGGLSLFALDTGKITPLLTPQSEYLLTDPDWSPQGDHYFFRISTVPAPQGIAGSWLGLAENPAGFFEQVPNNDAFCDWSPDGTKLACRSGTGEVLCSNIVLFSPAGDLITTLPQENDCHQVNQPAWSPDGKWISFVGDFTKMPKIYIIKPDGSSRTMVTRNMPFGNSYAWAPDGEKIAFLSGTSWNQDVFIANLNSSEEKNISLFTPGVQLLDWQPAHQAVDDAPPPITPTSTPKVLDLRDPQSIMVSFSNGLRAGEIEIFDAIFTEDTLQYGTGMAMQGGRDEISKSDFLQQLAQRLPSRPACAGYKLNPEGTSLTIWTKGWQPKWDLLGKPTSDVLTFSLLLLDGKIYTSAYFTPDPAILELPGFQSSPCP